MKINLNTKKCVAFLQVQKMDGSYIYVGTCFFIFFEKNEKPYSYVVTAKHVIEQVKKQYAVEEIFVKANLKNGQSKESPLKIEDWINHSDQNVDISICKHSIDDDYDHLNYPESSFMTDALIQSYEIGCGDEVFITGLFQHHVGNIKNSPICSSSDLI